MTIAPFEQIRLYYEFLTPRILEAQKKYIRHWVDPYGGIRWELYFSPIEELAWMAIRGFGQVPLYPQYPVLKYFIDFANPYVKVAIECDGKQFHQNKEKDYFRDEALFKNGWTIYRISGSELAYQTLTNKALFGKSYLRERFDKILYEYDYE